jgi:hypothetical protein
LQFARSRMVPMELALAVEKGYAGEGVVSGGDG